MRSISLAFAVLPRLGSGVEEAGKLRTPNPGVGCSTGQQVARLKLGCDSFAVRSQKGSIHQTFDSFIGDQKSPGGVIAHEIIRIAENTPTTKCGAARRGCRLYR